MPYGGHYRLVDVVLSNCHHSGLSDVWLTQQTNPVSLTDHLTGGRPWDLDRTWGGLLVLAPRKDKDTGKGGFASGTADVLWRHTELVRLFALRALVVVSSDAVYAQDYDRVVQGHLTGDADVTMVTTRVDAGEASRYGVVQVDDGRVTDYAYKPDEPASDLVTNEVFVFTPGPVLDLLDELGEAAGEDGLADLRGRPAAAPGRGRPRARAPLRGLLARPGHRRGVLVGAHGPARRRPALRPGPPGVAAADRRRRPARRPGARGCAPGRRAALTRLRRRRRVRRSVLSPDVVVEAGAEVVDSVLLFGAVVRGGARVQRAVLDEGVEVGSGCTVGGDGDLTVVGKGERVDGDLPAGARQPEVE